MRRYLLLFSLLLTLTIQSAYAHTLDFPWTRQERSQWCWVAVTVNTLKYYNLELTQCNVADEARTHGYTSYDFGSTNCCDDITLCNKPNGMSYISKLLQLHGINANTSVYGVLNQDQIKQNIDANKPVIFRWAWKDSSNQLTGNAHFLIIYGYNSNSDIINYYDPGYNEGFYTIEYDLLVDQPKKHIWTHYITLKNIPSTNCEDNKVCCTCSSKDLCCDGCKIISSAEDKICFDSTNPCKESGHCSNGVCTGIVNSTDGTTCIPEGDLCIAEGVCNNGTCLPTKQKECPDKGDCFGEGTCNPKTGACTYPAKPEGSECQPSDLCAESGYCSNYECKVKEFKNCKTDIPCHAEGRCDTLTGNCSVSLLPDGVSCDDGNLCTMNDTCSNGKCLGTNKICPFNECQSVGKCQPETGECVATNLPNGKSCGDNSDACVNQTCFNGECVESPISCDDDNPCTIDSCDNGCQHQNVPDNTICDVGKCSTGRCFDGVCTYSPEENLLSCDDGNPCTKNLCDNKKGCYFTPIGNGESCGKGKICQELRCIDDPDYKSRGCQNGTPSPWLLALAYLITTLRKRKSA